MKTIPIISATTVQLSEAFWPLFFTSKVVSRFVGGYICFGVTDHAQNSLLVYAHAVVDKVRPPTPQAIATAFPKANLRRRSYAGPDDLPIPYAEIGRLRLMQQQVFKQGQRTIYLLLPAESVFGSVAEEQLVFLQWSRPNEMQVARLLETIGQRNVLMVTKSALETRALVRLKQGERLKFVGSGFFFSSPDFDFAFPITCESCTA